MDLADALRRRRMVRNFTGEVSPAGSLDRVLAAAFRAPSAGNTAGLDLVVLTGPDTERYWATTFTPEGRDGFRWQGLFRAPELVVVVVDPAAYPERYGEPDKAATGLGAGTDRWPVPFWWIDAGMAVENILLAAVAEGLGACFFGLFGHEEAVRRELRVPAGRRLVGTVALGPPAPDEPGRSAGRGRPDHLHWTEWSSLGPDR